MQNEELELISTKHLIYTYIIFVMLFITFNFFALNNLSIKSETFILIMSFIIIFHIIFFAILFFSIKKIEDKKVLKEIETQTIKSTSFIDDLIGIKNEHDINLDDYKFEEFKILDEKIDNYLVKGIKNKENKITQKDVKVKNKIKEEIEKDKYLFADLELIDENNLFNEEILELENLNDFDFDDFYTFADLYSKNNNKNNKNNKKELATNVKKIKKIK